MKPTKRWRQLQMTTMMSSEEVWICRLKNTQYLIPQLHPLYDWFLNEQCSADNSCGDYRCRMLHASQFSARYAGAGDANRPGSGCWAYELVLPCADQMQTGRIMLA